MMPGTGPAITREDTILVSETCTSPSEVKESTRNTNLDETVPVSQPKGKAVLPAPQGSDSEASPFQEITISTSQESTGQGISVLSLQGGTSEGDILFSPNDGTCITDIIDMMEHPLAHTKIHESVIKSPGGLHKQEHQSSSVISDLDINQCENSPRDSVNYIQPSNGETSKIFICEGESNIVSKWDEPCSSNQQLQQSHDKVIGGEKRTSSGGEKKHSGKKSLLKYGELVILGYNGGLPQGDKGRKRSKFTLFQRPSSNGVKPARKSIVTNAQQSKAVKDAKQHSVSYTLSRHQTVIVEYSQDENTDMFQIGRSSETPIDFVVMDTVPGAQRAEDCVVTQSTISRFACRIIVNRNPPFTARIYAAGFDTERNIFLGEKATKWQTEDSSIDGLTTNGILIMHPSGGFNSTAKAGVWREVSVCGGVYLLRESRSAVQKGVAIESEDNILRDGTLIDLCGATLIWRSARGLLASPSPRELEQQIRVINAARPQCPVGLNTLVLPHRNTLTAAEKQPYVYLSCGHVHGQHGWGKKPQASGDDSRMCPMCITEGPFVQVKTGSENSFYVDNSSPSHCFCPCGHVSSGDTVKYWSQIPIPHGCHGFRAACPFCATPLNGDPGYCKLIFQDNLD